MPVEITLLNAMAGADLATAMDQHVRWGLRLLDLKDCLFGKNIADLSAADARRVAAMAAERGLGVYCFSTGLLCDAVEIGEMAVRQRFDAALPRVLEAARLLRPKVIRLLSMTTQQRGTLSNAVAYLRQQHRWAINVYRDAIDRICAAGFTPMIENEVGNAIFSTAEEILEFFEWLERDVKLIWDVSNLWQMGTPPTLATYKQLRPLIGSVHLKGGRAGEEGALAFAASLEDSTWPVREIVRRVIADRVSPVLVLNPPHGQRVAGYDYSDLTARDLRFLKELICVFEGAGR